VFELYQLKENLAEAHAFGPFPGPDERWNIGPAQQTSLYPTLGRWFGIPIPFADMKTSVHANLAREPADRRREAQLAVIESRNSRRTANANGSRAGPRYWALASGSGVL